MQNLFFTTHIEKNILTLVDQEAAHCALVLRKRVNDVIYVMDGKGKRYKAGIDEISKRGVKCTILGSEYKDPSEEVILAVAPTKNRDRLEWMIEKVVEIGVKSIVLLSTTNTERGRTNTERIEKKAISAVKQSLRYYVPDISELNFEEVLKLEAQNKYIAHCYDTIAKENLKAPTGTKLVLIGPEGDFTKEEVALAVDAGFEGLNLGEFRLRTETAAIVATTLLQ